jgi:hypothetical protein
MSGIISAVLTQIAEVAALYVAKFGRAEFALSDYKDESDPFVFDDFMDIDALTTLLGTKGVSGGGDTPEDGYGAVKKSMEQASWTLGSARFAVLFTDASSHTRGATEAQALSALQAEDCVFSYGIGTQPTFETLRTATGGVLVDDINAIADDLLPSVFIPFTEHHLDCADVGTASTNVITGLYHLEGESVRVVLNSAVMGDYMVASGSITLPTGSLGSYALGLPYTGTLKTMRLDTTLNNGASQGRKRRITECCFRFHQTQGCKFGKSLTALNEIQFRTWADDPSVGAPKFTGEKIVAWPMGYSGDAEVFIVQDQPLPCTLLGLAIKHDFLGD